MRTSLGRRGRLVSFFLLLSVCLAALPLGAEPPSPPPYYAITDVRVVILRLSLLQRLDATGAQTLAEIVGELESRGVTGLIKVHHPPGTLIAMKNIPHQMRHSPK